MPLFKPNDFWYANNNYYATDRYKSVVLYNDKIYICTETHKSTDTFDNNKFIEATGSGGGDGNLIAGEWDIVNSIEITHLHL